MAAEKPYKLRNFLYGILVYGVFQVLYRMSPYYSSDYLVNLGVSLAVPLAGIGVYMLIGRLNKPKGD